MNEVDTTWALLSSKALHHNFSGFGQFTVPGVAPSHQVSDVGYASLGQVNLYEALVAAETAEAFANPAFSNDNSMSPYGIPNGRTRMVQSLPSLRLDSPYTRDFRSLQPSTNTDIQDIPHSIGLSSCESHRLIPKRECGKCTLHVVCPKYITPKGTCKADGATLANPKDHLFYWTEGDCDGCVIIDFTYIITGGKSGPRKSNPPHKPDPNPKGHNI